MYCQDLEFEKLDVPESIGLPLHGLDLVVGPLEGACADRIVVVGQEAGTMCIQRLGHLHEHVYSRRLGPPNPVVQERGGEPLARLLPELPQVFLHVVGQRQGPVQLQGLLQALLLVPLGVKVLGGFQQQPPDPLEDFLLLVFGSVVQPPPQVRQLVVEQLDDVEVVIDDR